MNWTKNSLLKLILKTIVIVNIIAPGSLIARNNIVSDSLCSIRGEVWAGNHRLSKGKMYIYSDSKSFPAHTFVPIEDGNFFVTNLDSGPNYFLYAVPEIELEEEHSPEYFPTYFSESEGTPNYNWQIAHKLNFSTTLAIDSVSIFLVKRDYIFYGSGKISGTIDMSTWGDTLQNSCVLLLDSSFNPLKYTFLNIDNSFVFDHIPFGSYYLLVDKFYVKDIEHPISIDVYSPSSEVDIYPGTEGKNPTNDLITSNKTYLYPNPFNNYLRINSDNNSNDIQITLFNWQGQIIPINNIDKQNYPMEINTSNLSNGIYFIKISNQTFKVQKISN